MSFQTIYLKIFTDLGVRSKFVKLKNNKDILDIYTILNDDGYDVERLTFRRFDNGKIIGIYELIRDIFKDVNSEDECVLNVYEKSYSYNMEKG